MVCGLVVQLLQIANFKNAGFQSITFGRFLTLRRIMPILSVVSCLGQIQAMLTALEASLSDKGYLIILMVDPSREDRSSTGDRVSIGRNLFSVGVSPH